MNDKHQSNEKSSSGAAKDDSRKGQQTQGGSKDKSGSGQRGGSENFANNPEKASEAGKKGGEHSHKGSKK